MTNEQIAAQPAHIKERFWSKVDVRSKEECWPWMASTNDKGYGQMGVPGTVVLAHRLAFIFSGGDYSAGPITRHLCANPICVNPSHLIAGTHQDNMDDMLMSGTSARGIKNGSIRHPDKRARGSRHGSKTHPERVARGISQKGRKLNVAAAEEIRRLYATGLISLRKLGKQFGVSYETINLVVKGKMWVHPSMP